MYYTEFQSRRYAPLPSLLPYENVLCCKHLEDSHPSVFGMLRSATRLLYVPAQNHSSKDWIKMDVDKKRKSTNTKPNDTTS